MKRCLYFLTKSYLPHIGYFMTVLVLLQLSLGAQTLQENLPVTNGIVYDMVRDGNTLYVGGVFSYAGPNTGKGVFLDYNTALLDQSFPKVNGIINTCVSDNNGGWFIGGIFTKVGQSFRNNLAHIRSDGTVDPWNPNPNGEVKALSLVDSTIYLGGYFNQVGGITRNYLAAVDVITRSTTPWNPDPDGAIYSISATKNTVYAGGLFGKVNSNTVFRSNLAAFDAISGLVTSWDIGVSGFSGYLSFVVYGMKLANNDSTLYLWGNIGAIGGTTRRGVGAVNTYNNTVTQWNPNAYYNGSAATVYALAISGDTVFVGGTFTRMKSTSTVRNKIAALTKVGTGTFGSGTLLPWDPNISGNSTNELPVVKSLAVSNGVVYAGGAFTTVGSTMRSNLAGIDALTGLATDWDPHCPDGYDQQPNVIVPSVSNLFIGGGFNLMNGFPRKGVAAIDLLTNTVSTWDAALAQDEPGAPVVEYLAHSGSNIFLGGTFATATGQPKRNFAVIDKSTGLPVDFLSSTTFGYPAPIVAVNGNRLYISGNFSVIGDSTRNRLASVDLITEQVTGWNPRVNGDRIYSFAFSGTTIYLGGAFDTVGITPRHNLAAVDNTIGNVLPWNPHTDPIQGIGVYAMEVSGSNIYIGGHFDYIGTTPRKSLAAIDAITGEVIPWNPTLAYPGNLIYVRDLKVAGSTIYVGGAFQTVGGILRRSIAAIDLQAGAPTSWDPNLGPSEVYALDLDLAGQVVYLGGYFSTVNSDPSPSLAGYTDPSLQGTTTFQLIVSIEDNWNMVSVPGLHPVNQNVNTWWSGRDITTPVYKFANGYQSVTAATPGEGYWMFHLGANTYNTGDEWPAGGINLVPNDPIVAASGWNLIGGYENTVATSGVTTSPSGLITGSFYQYIPNTGYQSATTLTPGYGYWVELSGAGSINIPLALEKTTNTSVNKIKENWGNIIINDAAGKSYTLYSTNESSELNSFNLPPLPPAGLFDVRFGSQRFVEDLYSSSNTINLNGVTYPVTLSVKGMDLNLEDVIDGSKVSTVVKDGNSFVLSNSSISTLKVSSIAVVPIEYSLEQNYPNPFNPTTTIKFSLPEVSNVKLTIYNALGQKVEELVNSRLEIGSYSFNWNASNLASGLYFYEIHSNNFTAVKKMMLLK